jgi:Lon-like protease
LIRRLGALAPAAVLLLCLGVVRAPWFAIGPGPAEDVLPRIDIDGAPTYASDGRLLLTTVTPGHVTVFGAIRGWLDPEVELVPERAFLVPGQTQEEFDRASLSIMDESTLAAASVALEATSGYPEQQGEGVIVYRVAPGSPADGVLFPGDVIVEAGGAELVGLPDLRRALDAVGDGGTLELEVRPIEGGELRRVEVRPTLLAEEGRPIIGIEALANFPFDVRIDSGDIGGPSAGLLWALGVADLLTPEDLTAGRTLAGTGSIDIDGAVYPIGGVREKILAAERAGAEVFLLPAENLAEAQVVGAGLELVPVASFAEAVQYLEGP